MSDNKTFYMKMRRAKDLACQFPQESGMTTSMNYFIPESMEKAICGKRIPLTQKSASRNYIYDSFPYWTIVPEWLEGSDNNE